VPRGLLTELEEREERREEVRRRVRRTEERVELERGRFIIVWGVEVEFLRGGMGGRRKKLERREPLRDFLEEVVLPAIVDIVNDYLCMMVVRSSIRTFLA